MGEVRRSAASTVGIGASTGGVDGILVWVAVRATSISLISCICASRFVIRSGMPLGGIAVVAAAVVCRVVILDS